MKSCSSRMSVECASKRGRDIRRRKEWPGASPEIKAFFARMMRAPGA
jgi:hypothetical protein